jgi:DNA processing protein
MANRQDETKYWVALSRISAVGRVRVERLERYFGLLERAWEASSVELREAGIEEKVAASIVAQRRTLSPDAEMERLQRLGIEALTWNDSRYPPRLRHCSDRPPVLYVRGSLEERDEWAVGVVGTRRATVYGRQAAETIAGDLTRHQVTVVSGLARGIDSVAHQAALQAGGRTIAVLPCSLDKVYPVQNTRLAQAIREQGALVSEYPPGMPIHREFFFRRNRIIAGMTLGVLVVEAGERSGALLTAQNALEENREVFAVPGSIFSPYSRGTNELIQAGAKLARDAKDVLSELNLTMVAEQVEVQAALPADESELTLLRHMSAEPAHIDEIGRLAQLSPAAVSGALALLELKGLVREVGGLNYVRLH